MLAKKLGLQDGFSVKLVNDAEMLHMNLQFAGRGEATDVLSFPNQPSADCSYLGDILISVETAQRQSNELENELKILALHGVLHLLGYDHATDGGEMRNLEDRLRKELDLP